MSDDIDRSDWTAEMIEDDRLERTCSPLFDMYLAFEREFASHAIDKLDVSDADAETYAVRMSETDTDAGRSFARLLRCIRHERNSRVMFHRVSAVWAARGKSEAISFDEANREYANLNKGEA